MRVEVCVAMLEGLEAAALRNAILSRREAVDLISVLGACWGLGVPVITVG